MAMRSVVTDLIHKEELEHGVKFTCRSSSKGFGSDGEINL